jgi:hypothetical protein
MHLMHQRLPVLLREHLPRTLHDLPQRTHAYAGHTILVLDHQLEVDVQQVREAPFQAIELLKYQLSPLLECRGGG